MTSLKTAAKETTYSGSINARENKGFQGMGPEDMDMDRNMKKLRQPFQEFNIMLCLQKSPTN